MNCLKQIREAKGLSQCQLAALTGIDQPNISAYENGQRMREDTVIRFAEALGCRPGEILGDKK